jgi:hypothetical protein
MPPSDQAAHSSALSETIENAGKLRNQRRKYGKVESKTDELRLAQILLLHKHHWDGFSGYKTRFWRPVSADMNRYLNQKGLNAVSIPTMKRKIRNLETQRRLEMAGQAGYTAHDRDPLNQALTE